MIHIGLYNTHNSLHTLIHFDQVWRKIRYSKMDVPLKVNLFRDICLYCKFYIIYAYFLLNFFIDN